MQNFNSTTPELRPIAQCDTSLQFESRFQWPEGLPAVAINGTVFAGFHQVWVFNHEIPVSDQEKIASLFRSLYPEISFSEMSVFVAAARSKPWIPISEIAAKFGWQPTEQFFKVCDALLSTPLSFRTWCAEKKMAPQDLMPLLSVTEQDLSFLFEDIIQLGLSKSAGSKALELGIELLLMGYKPEILSAKTLNSVLMKNQSTAEAWVEGLRQLRFPETHKRDQAQAEKLTSLPWPGSSQPRWIRQGDRAGIELKLFVTHSSDLKKYLQSLLRVQDQWEQETTTGAPH